MCTFVILGSAQSFVQGGIVFVLGKARSGLISLLASSLTGRGFTFPLCLYCVWHGCFYIEYMVVVVCLKWFYAELECV
jgi:hypothetical protein